MRNQSQTTPHNSHVANAVLHKPYYNAEDYNTEVVTEVPVTEPDNSEMLNTALNKVKIELINNKKNILIEKIKKAVIEHVYYTDKQINLNFSDYLSQKLGYHYTYMANLFVRIQGVNIQNYIITTKIERVKELLVYEGLTLTEISFKMHYSSVAHLSNQFKKVTGMNPSQYMASFRQVAGTSTPKSPGFYETNPNYSNEQPSSTVSAAL